MSVAHLHDQKILTVTFTTTGHSVWYECPDGAEIIGRNGRVVQIVGCSDCIDRLAIELGNDKNVSIVHADWFLDSDSTTK